MAGYHCQAPLGLPSIHFSLFTFHLSLFFRLGVGRRRTNLSADGALTTRRRRTTEAQTADNRQGKRRFADAQTADNRQFVGGQTDSTVGAGSHARPRRRSRQPKWVRFQALPETRPYDNPYFNFLDFSPKIFRFFVFFPCFSLSKNPIFPKFLPQNWGPKLLKSLLF